MLQTLNVIDVLLHNNFRTCIKIASSVVQSSVVCVANVAFTDLGKYVLVEGFVR